MKREISELLIKLLLQQMEILILLLEDFKYVLGISGVLSVSISGVMEMLLWLFNSLEFLMLIVIQSEMTKCELLPF